uniref:Uncharacterized protein n=1 Tax=Megaselia scalaris TaxID=36166 RepID=T1GQI7_MEGSC
MSGQSHAGSDESMNTNNNFQSGQEPEPDDSTDIMRQHFH